MSTFRRKPVDVQAWHLTLSAWHHPFPDWLARALDGKRVLRPAGAGPLLLVQGWNGFQEVRAGDWITEDAEGRLATYTNTAFLASFDPLDAAAVEMVPGIT